MKSTRALFLTNTIKVERAKLDMTQKKLAQNVGVTVLTIHSIEKNKKIPSVKLAMEIAEVFNVSVHQIFGLENQNQNND